jgi:Toprim-like
MHDAELDTFKRDINLVEYAIERWGYRRLPRESSRSCHVLGHEVHHDKVLITREADGHWVYCSVRDERDNGTIIDFVQHRTRDGLGRVRADLRQWLGLPRPDPGPDQRPSCPPVVRDRRAVVAAFAAARTLRNSSYLNARGIRPETLQGPRFRGTWRVDARGNVLFPHHDEEGLCGFEAKNRGFTGFASGGAKAIWESARRPSDTIVLIAESAIDAISYAQIHQTEHVWYWSTAGTVGADQAARLDRRLGALPRGMEIAAGVDADLGGRTLAAALAQLAAKHGLSFAVTTPAPGQGKDWNDLLQLQERDYIASLRGPERGTSTERGR